MVARLLLTWRNGYSVALCLCLVGGAGCIVALIQTVSVAMCLGMLALSCSCYLTETIVCTWAHSCLATLNGWNNTIPRNYKECLTFYLCREVHNWPCLLPCGAISLSAFYPREPCTTLISTKSAGMLFSSSSLSLSCAKCTFNPQVQSVQLEVKG